MYFIEHDSFALEAFQEALRVLHFPTLPRQLAVKVFDVLQSPATRGLPRPSHTGEPNYRTVLPQTLQPLRPKGA
jgi:hypothetical protein